MLRSLLLSSVFALLLTSYVSAQQWAEKMFSNKAHDFGTVARGADVVYRFEVTNLYKEDIHLSNIRTSCGCTTPTIETKVIKSMQTGFVSARFNTRTFSGTRSATLTVSTYYTDKNNRRHYGEVQLRVHGTIRSDIVFTPGSIKFDNVDQGSLHEKRISVTYAGRNTWKINDVRSANENLEVELTETGRQWGRVSYELLIRLKEGAPAGFMKDQLVLVTNDSNNTRIPVDIEGRIVPEISVSPQQLILGEVTDDEQITKKLIVRGKKPFKITNVACEGEGCFSFHVDDKSKPMHLVEITFNTCDVPTGKVKKAIHITTDRGNNIGAMFTVYATVVPGEEEVNVEEAGAATELPVKDQKVNEESSDTVDAGSQGEWKQRDEVATTKSSSRQ